MEDDFSLPSAFLQLARRQPELVGEGWEERGERDPFLALPRLFGDHSRVWHHSCSIARKPMRTCPCKSLFSPPSAQKVLRAGSSLSAGRFPSTSCCWIFSQVQMKSRACWGGFFLPPDRSGTGRSVCPFPFSHTPVFSLVAT